MKLTAKQSSALRIMQDNQTRELLFGGGAGGAKSFLGAYWLLKSCLRYKGTRWLMGRAKLKTLKETTLKSFLEVCNIQGVKPNVHFKLNNQSNTITFINGSEILLKDLFYYPSDPEFDELGSLEITGAFIDECNQIVYKAKEIVSSRIRYKLDEAYGIPKILMSCNPAKNWTYSVFYKPSKENTLQDDRKFIQALAKDNPFISPEYIRSLQSLNKNSRERLLNGNWEYDDDPATLINIDKIMAIFSNNFDTLKGDKYITCDVARFGKDKTVIMVWDGWHMIELIEIDKNKVTEAAAEINRLRQKHNVPVKNIVVDEDGVGGGVVDIVGCVGFVNNSKAVELKDDSNYENLKTQCYYRYAKRVNNSGVYIHTEISEDQKAYIVEEHEQIKTRDQDKDGKKKIIRKEEIKQLIGRSPDYSDCMMMREYLEIKDSSRIFDISSF